MKKLILLFFFISVVGFPQDIVQVTHRLVKHQCMICGKDIWHCENIPEERNWDSGTYLYSDMSFIECYRDEHQQAECLDATFKIEDGFVCKECYEKYVLPIQDKITKEYSVYMDKVKRDNKEFRDYNDKIRKQAEIDELKDKLKEVQYQIDLKEGKIKPKIDTSARIFYWQNGRITVDTVQLIIHPKSKGKIIYDTIN